jgi:hypothetical protein
MTSIGGDGRENWVEENPAMGSFHPLEAIDEYLQGPQLLEEAVRGMDREQLQAKPIPGKWSTLEVVCHVADMEMVYADRMKRVLAEETPTLWGADPDRFAASLAYHQRDVEDELQLIRLVRRQMAHILRSVPKAAWSRQGRHSEAGLLTLRDLLQRITAHIPHHVRFIHEKRRALGLTAA